MKHNEHIGKQNIDRKILFSLALEVEVMEPAEMVCLSSKTTILDMEENDHKMKNNLDLLQEKGR